MCDLAGIPAELETVLPETRQVGNSAKRTGGLAGREIAAEWEEASLRRQPMESIFRCIAAICSLSSCNSSDFSGASLR